LSSPRASGGDLKRKSELKFQILSRTFPKPPPKERAFSPSPADQSKYQNMNPEKGRDQGCGEKLFGMKILRTNNESLYMEYYFYRLPNFTPPLFPSQTETAKLY